MRGSFIYLRASVGLWRALVGLREGPCRSEEGLCLTEVPDDLGWYLRWSSSWPPAGLDLTRRIKTSIPTY